MAGDAEERLWRAEELEVLVQWIKEPGNRARLKNGSGFTKKADLTPLVDRLATRNSQQVFNSIKRSHMKAAQMNNQSGWGLTKEDLDEGKTTQLELYNLSYYNAFIDSDFFRQAQFYLSLLFPPRCYMGFWAERKLTSDPSKNPIQPGNPDCSSISARIRR
jgi:hypothetical protein